MILKLFRSVCFVFALPLKRHEKKLKEKFRISKMNKDLEIKDLDIKLDGTDVDYYNDAATYWKGVDCTINGMLGGFGKITDIDIDSSNKLLKLLFKVKNIFFCLYISVEN